uniref:Alpha-carbonic anhydrase domain-containing protein n=1 Tax=Triticum urartu TaxID=4572 RepID=A0A8R7VDW4_TRIUA
MSWSLYLKRMADTREKEEMVSRVDPWEARGDGDAYYRYMGSLTTPGCDEGVIWTIIKRVATVSSHQLKLLTNDVDDGFEMNARPLQKVNGRDISFFCPDDDHERYYAAADH